MMTSSVSNSSEQLKPQLFRSILIQAKERALSSNQSSQAVRLQDRQVNPDDTFNDTSLDLFILMTMNDNDDQAVSMIRGALVQRDDDE